MSTSVGVLLRRPRSVDASGTVVSARQVPTALLLAWAALFFNVLTPSGNETLVPVPHMVSQAMAQGSLVAALVLAILANPKLVLRPSYFMVLLGLMAVVALMVSLHSPYLLGSTYRGLRLLAFVACLWLLTPYWGRTDMVLLRAHRLCLWAALTTVLIGAAVAPGKAFSFEGRLAGALWPITPTQVAHFAAILVGTTVVLWMCRVISGRHAALALAVGIAVLIGTHTRTAILGAVLGLVVASASLFLGHARVRRTSLGMVVVGVLAGTVFAPQIVSWASRGQSAEQARGLTGRTTVWTASLSQERPRLVELFGSGLSNKSFDGLAIDSNWVASYLDLGWFGIAVQITILLALLAIAITRPRGPRRALALFLITYCIVSSVTETGLGDASTYMLDLVVAASLLVPQAGRGVR